jgi:excisionase family DNA binding protein
MRRLLTPKEFAEAVGMSVASVHKRVRTGSLPAIRFGKSLRFDPELVMEGTGLRRKEEITRMEAYQVMNHVASLSIDSASSHRKFHKAHSLLTAAVAKAVAGLMDDATGADIEHWRGMVKWCSDCIKAMEQMGLTNLSSI